MVTATQGNAGTTDVSDELVLMTGEAVGLDLRPTSFVLRAAGAIIDFVAYIGLWLLILLALSSPVLRRFFDEASATAFTLASLVFCIVVVPTTIETLSQGKSLGKLAVGGRIVRDDGGSIGFRHAFIRALVGVLELFSTLGAIASLTALFNGRAKRMGDLLAGTYSQNERVSKITPPVYSVPLELVGWAATADVARMPDGLSRRIAQFLRQATRLTPDARDRLSRSLATEASVFVSPLPAVNAELFLAAVSVLRRDREYTGLTQEAQRLEHLRPALEGLPHGFPER
jgi:uncharacterized RDD family membrane protein YckC